MSTTLADIYSPPRIEEIDAELDRFNDDMLDLGYQATHQSLKWGEGKIEVTAEDGGQVVAEFFTGTPGFLDDFRNYTNFALDTTSVPRAEIKEATKP